jgi:hypothetical protein
VTSRIPTLAHTWHRLIGSAIGEFDRRYGSSMREGWKDVLRSAFAPFEPPPSAFEHRDFAPWNVVIDPAGRLSVLDWESSHHGVAGPDLIYFLTHLTFYRDGLLGRRRRPPTMEAFRRAYRAAWDPCTPSGRTNVACLTAYARGVHVDRAALKALRLFTWLVHAPIEHRRLAGAAEPGADAPEGLFVTLLSEDWRPGQSGLPGPREGASAGSMRSERHQRAGADAVDSSSRAWLRLAAREQRG